ncbi:DUF4326 domain-containing protein [Vibrio splendidus]|nr:DUF4326 domain-containing protein [Vibrio splendidus]
MIKIANKKTHEPKNGWIDVYIGRGSPLGNPYPITPTDSRRKVCKKYEKYFNERVVILGDPVREEVKRIFRLVMAGENINLICYCFPLQCHGETLLDFLTRHLPIEHLSDKAEANETLSLF